MSGVRWCRGIDDNQIVSSEGHIILKAGPDTFLAFGPPGSQDVSYIQANTARHIQETWGYERRACDVRVDTTGRRLLGVFTGPEEARDGCSQEFRFSSSCNRQRTPGRN